MARRISTADVTTAAELKGVPPELALAIWKQESSSGSNTKTSPKGAVGGFQVMPATFRRYMPGGDINDPVDNMMAGLDVLADCLKKSGGDPKGASQCYYSGRVLKAGETGPNSGPGTPSVLEYSNQVLAKMRGSGWTDTPVMAAGMAEVVEEPDLGSMYGAVDEDVMEGEFEETDDIAGLTRPLDMNVNAPGLGGMGDAQMGLMGSQNYELDRYIRKIVDEEFKNG